MHTNFTVEQVMKAYGFDLEPMTKINDQYSWYVQRSNHILTTITQPNGISPPESLDEPVYVKLYKDYDTLVYLALKKYDTLECYLSEYCKLWGEKKRHPAIYK